MKKAENKKWFLLFLFVWCVQMLTAFYFCCQKQGFHEDEYYTFYSTARTYGLSFEDRTWMEHDSYFDEFVVLEGQGFQYGLVKLVQSWDVHPPFYYWVFHTVCSFFPGQFSKWFGLSINLAAFGVSMFLLRFLALQVTKQNEKLSFLICLFYGFTPAVISSVVFIRMYVLLTVFVYLCAILHINMIEHYKTLNNDTHVKLPFLRFLLPLAVVTYLGFLTQYYYFIFLFFIALAFCIYLLWKERNLWNCVRYGVSLGIAFVLAYLTYPACLGQMFRGQRGAQAVDNFFDGSNTFERIVFFWKLLDENVFGKMLVVFLVLLLFLFVYAVKKGHINIQGHMKIGVFLEKYRTYLLLLFTVIGYFFAVSKTALMLGNTSIRYQVPIYGIVVLLIFCAISKVCEQLGTNKLWIAAALICVIIDISGLLSGHVQFLYPEASERIAYARERAAQNTPVVYLYDKGRTWTVWNSTSEFNEYGKIYFDSQDDEDLISDLEIDESIDLVVYINNMADTEAQLQRILNSNINVTDYTLQWQDEYCDIYYFY